MKHWVKYGNFSYVRLEFTWSNWATKIYGDFSHFWNRIKHHNNQTELFMGTLHYTIAHCLSIDNMIGWIFTWSPLNFSDCPIRNFSYSKTEYLNLFWVLFTAEQLKRTRKKNQTTKTIRRLRQKLFHTRKRSNLNFPS